MPAKRKLKNVNSYYSNSETRSAPEKLPFLIKKIIKTWSRLFVCLFTLRIIVKKLTTQ